ARLQEAFRNGTSPYMPGCLGGVDLGVDLGPLLDLTASSCGSELRAAAASAAAEPAPNPTGAALEQQVALDLTASSAAPSPRRLSQTEVEDAAGQAAQADRCAAAAVEVPAQLPAGTGRKHEVQVEPEAIAQAQPQSAQAEQYYIGEEAPENDVQARASPGFVAEEVDAPAGAASGGDAVGRTRTQDSALDLEDSGSDGSPGGATSIACQLLVQRSSWLAL
ncbi:unnamed protein product, partial [Prorocentrum cordatum]